RNISGLAVRVAKNCCISLYRKRQAEQQLSHADTDLRMLNQHDSSGSPQELLEAKDVQRMLTEAMALLKPRERQLFEMRQTENLSTEQISQQTGIPKPSVTAMVSAARKKVFTELKRRMKQ
ncbi:MAG: sigma-70 family RNA polymerase sigma factor, partial [Prevotella sp.]|nr:sigma-70 family RNA polymerase sigma factor [Prevotella sp.]